MKKKLLAVAALAGLITSSRANASLTYDYVGSWIVGNGPEWITNPPVYSGQSAAALLFGGNPSDYVTSTVDSNIADINFKTFLDGYGDTRYLTNPAPDYYDLSSNGGYYNESPSFSAYVLDHTCTNRYSNISSGCQGDGTQYVNYAFKVSATGVSDTSIPEPATFVMLGGGLLGLGALNGRRKIST
jgi:hypothetical protein